MVRCPSPSRKSQSPSQKSPPSSPTNILDEQETKEATQTYSESETDQGICSEEKKSKSTIKRSGTGTAQLKTPTLCEKIEKELTLFSVRFNIICGNNKPRGKKLLDLLCEYYEYLYWRGGIRNFTKDIKNDVIDCLTPVIIGASEDIEEFAEVIEKFDH